MEIQEIENRVKELTNEKRFKHSQGVMQVAGELAEYYGLDVQKARLAGLAHDCVKNVPCEKMFELAHRLGCELDEVTKLETKLIHAPLGAYYAKKVFEIDDEEIFSAIYYHTTAKRNMTLFEKVIYIADVIEPNRNFDIVDQLRRLAYEDIDKAILLVIDFTVCKIIERGGMVHTNTIDARNYLISKGVKV